MPLRPPRRDRWEGHRPHEQHLGDMARSDSARPAEKAPVPDTPDAWATPTLRRTARTKRRLAPTCRQDLEAVAVAVVPEVVVAVERTESCVENKGNTPSGPN